MQIIFFCYIFQIFVLFYFFKFIKLNLNFLTAGVSSTCSVMINSLENPIHINLLEELQKRQVRLRLSFLTLMKTLYIGHKFGYSSGTRPRWQTGTAILAGDCPHRSRVPPWVLIISFCRPGTVKPWQHANLCNYMHIGAPMVLVQVFNSFKLWSLQSTHN